MRLTQKWLLGFGVVAMAAACTASAAALGAHAPRPGARAPEPHVLDVPALRQQRSVYGPYISAAVAERAALASAAEMGPGADVLEARLMTVAAASKAAGIQVAGNETSDSREVWLVWMRGSYRILNCITATACPTKFNQIFLEAIDAKTGFVVGEAWMKTYQHPPLASLH